MALNKTMTFDLELKPGGIPPIVHASQGDIGRMFKANIYWDGSAATSYISGATVNLRGRKPDKTVFDYSATLAGSMVTFETTEQMTIISGPVECELVFSNDGDIIASANFVLMVEDSPYNPDAPSESVIPGIEDLIEQTIGGDVRDEVQAELEAHPEWTTTVQDGAITKAKINTVFLPEIKNAYVTPEQFGAVGDGVTDDTEAFKQAIATSLCVVIPDGDYYLTDTLELGKITVKGAGLNRTNLIFDNCDGLTLNDREVCLEGVTVLNKQNNQTNKGLYFKHKTAGATFTHMFFKKIRVVGFEYGFLAVDNQLWSNLFADIQLTLCKHALYIDMAENSINYSFCNHFIGLRGESLNGYALRLRGTHCQFDNLNMSCNNINSVYHSASYSIFNNCNFETDEPITANGSVMQLDGYAIFNNCRFLDNFSTAGDNYFMTSINDSNRKAFQFNNCRSVSYTGSQMTDVCNRSFGRCTHSDAKYPTVIENFNIDFSIFDTVFNGTKPFIRKNGQPIRLIKDLVDTSKLSTDEIYLYRNGSSSVNNIIAMFNGTNLVAYDGTVLV